MPVIEADKADDEWEEREAQEKGSDLLGAKPSVNVSPVSPEPYLYDLCIA